MSNAIEHHVQHIDDFFEVGRRGAEARAKDHENGAAVFLRLNEGERLDLVAKILDAWLDEEDLNLAMASGALRHAWDSEPYVGGIRAGSYVTSAAARLYDATQFSMSEFIEDWGESLMSETEKQELRAMEFPLTVYRGGRGTFDEVAFGVCWSLKSEIASFYAHEWPQRWGCTKDPVIVTATVDEDEVFAFLNDRSEGELLIPYPDHIENVKPLAGLP